MNYIPHTEHDQSLMLKEIGLSSIKDLFKDIPSDYLYPHFKIEEGLSEQEVYRVLKGLSQKNRSFDTGSWFLGGGIYNHFIPSTIDTIVSRGEFLTSYTPYQPEVSQGTLQAIFEFQTMVAALYKMEVVNASHYDGATALAEGILMALRVKSKRQKVVLCEGIHPEYKRVLDTYIQGMNIELSSGPIDDNTACVVAFYPTFLGEMQNYHSLVQEAHDKGALALIHADPLACSLFTPPGEWGADIVTGEGQPLGIPMNYGGPSLGLFATSQKLIRKMPGRVVGQTEDGSKTKGCVLTFAAREQHIRREKATSNICSNQGLMALRAAIYMASMGKTGLKETAQLCYDKTVYAKKQLGSLKNCFVKQDQVNFREFVLHLDLSNSGISLRDLQKKLKDSNILIGLNLSLFFKEREDQVLFCVTEQNSKKEIDALVNILREILQ